MILQSIILSLKHLDTQEGIERLVREYIGDKECNLDWITISTKEGKETIGVEQIGQIIEWNSKKSSDIKVCLIKNAHRLTNQAQNSLLKIIEEPSPNTLLVLETRYVDSLLETIRSRCILIVDRNNTSEKTVSDFNVQDFLKLKFMDQDLMLTDFVKSREELGIFLECLQNYIVDTKASINNEHLDKKNVLEYVEQWNKSNKANVNIKLITESIMAHLGNYE
jgi:hypothetical protein